MKKVAEVITRIGGRRSKNGYGVLCQVVEAALRDMPEERSIGALCAEVGQRCGKKGETIYKSLARSVRDIWENGDRQTLEQVAGCRFREEPSPKELVMELDPKAFLIVQEAHQVLGDGFARYSRDAL